MPCHIKKCDWRFNFRTMCKYENNKTDRQNSVNREFEFLMGFWLMLIFFSFLSVFTVPRCLLVNSTMGNNFLQVSFLMVFWILFRYIIDVHVIVMLPSSDKNPVCFYFPSISSRSSGFALQSGFHFQFGNIIRGLMYRYSYIGLLRCISGGLSWILRVNPNPRPVPLL